ncbi:MAG: tetratricopeptide repeat protein, partial [Planctomycetota bacterium]
AAILVALLAGTTASTWFAIQANNAASTAENRLASAVASFQAVDPNYGASNGMTALQFLTSAKKNVSQSLSEDKEGRALILKSIADSMRGLGESKLALETYQEALDLYFQINAATSDEAALEIKRELATIHLDLSQLEPSLTLLNETENGFRALYGSDDRRTMLIQSIRIEWEIKKGNIKRAVELADELRLKYELLNLQNSEEGLINLKYLAKSYQENGQNDEAKEILKALLDEYSKSQGPDSLAALQIGTSLAVCYADLGDYPKAIDQGLEVFKLQQQKLEPDHPMIAINFLNLSTFYGNVGQYEQAMEYAEKSVDIATRGFGPKANETLNYKQTLATLQFLMGKPTEAQRNLEEILEFQSTELGYAHPDTLSTASNLSVVYSRTGQREKSLKLVTRLVDESTESLGQDHPTTLRLQRDLVVSLFYGGQKDKAIDLSKRMVDAHGRVLGDEHPDTLAVITNHGSLLLRLDRYEEAIGFLAEIHDKRVKLFGPENPTSLQTESELAFCHSKMGNHQIAIQKSWNVFETAERVLGPDHPVTLSYLEKTAKDHRRAQLYGDAEKLNRLLLDRRQNSSEESESDKMAAQYNLAIAQMLGNRLELALKNFRAVFKQEKLDTEFLSEDAMDTAIFILEIATRLEDLDVSNEVCNEVVNTIESPDCDLDDSIQLTGLVTVLESKVKNSDLESIEPILSQLKQISIDDPWMDARIQAATAQSKLKSDPDLAMQQLQSAIDSLLPEGEPISKLLDVIPERGLWIPIFWMDQMVRASSNRAEPVIEELKRDRADLKVAVEFKFMPLATSVIRLD